MCKKVGVAIDIGTTTVALYVVDLDTGEKLRTVGGMNAQAPYGADVTSRISYCMSNGHEKLTQLIREQIDGMLAGGGILDVPPSEIVIAGNTIMQHLAAGYSPVSMGAAPFTPMSLFGETLPAWDSLPVRKNASIYYTPAISAYVGGDITAGLLAAGFEDIEESALFIDIGTNGEIVLKHKGTYYCCAAAAGPAFEGAEISMGMAAVEGAIDHVWQGQGGNIEYSVIGGGAEPKGLCGSGLLDLLAVLLETGAVDETGRLIGAGIYMTAADIRKLQLAKAAIAGGIQVLLHYAGIKESDISMLALAGGFGSYLDPRSAARIGLFPKALLPVARSYGNTAGEGAVMALCDEASRATLEDIRKRCEYIELSSNALFNDKFTEELFMP